MIMENLFLRRNIFWFETEVSVWKKLENFSPGRSWLSQLLDDSSIIIYEFENKKERKEKKMWEKWRKKVIFEVVAV